MKLNYDASKKEWRKRHYKVLIAASNGDKQALAQFFSMAEFMDGEAAEGYFP